MTSKDDRLYLDHIAESIGKIAEYTAGGRATFIHSGVLQDATLRRLQTFAESTQRLSTEIKERHPEIPWREIAAFRHRIVHDYLSSFDLELAWTFIEKDLPQLKSAIGEELERR
ncbi:MAG TPA: HepT-like ribonuclease domain-containing protein [Chloroflexota bacterium]|nr:HepT-like ribonuclease domain-containing protein [Chloroflexota bacterium]